MERNMKNMDDTMNMSGNDNDNNTCNAKWLRFSSTDSTSFYENNAFHSYVMPLNSDTSLCFNENPSRSQHSQDSFPKLENLLGNATMEAHYDNYESEAMALSLDSIYYQQHVDDQETQQKEVHLQYFSGMPCYEMYQTSAIQENVVSQTDDLFSGNFKGQETDNSTMIHDHGSNAPVSGSVESVGHGDLQCLSLSMSPGSQSSSFTPSGAHCLAIETKKRGGSGKISTKQPSHRKSIDTFGQRTSQYRGVTRHRWTGRYEAHLWDNSSTKEGQTRKGRQGGYDVEEKAARAYDCAALKYWGSETHINFPLESYQQQLEDMKRMNRQEYVAHLRRRSSGFSRGASIYRGVTKHHQHGRWQARIGRVAGNKDLYLGTYRTQEEAAEAYDIAAIKFRGANSVTNFEMIKYDVEKIIASDTLLSGEQARRVNCIQEPRLTNAIVEYVIPSSVAPSHDNRSSSDWKVMLNQFPDQQQQNVEPVAEKAIFMGHEQAQKHYKNLSFSVAIQDFIGDETMISTQLMLDDSSTKIDNGHHFSDPSSLVTSLSSSREASPDKPGDAASMLFAKTTSVSSWISSAHISMAHLPC
ncbi:AP2-like ethylene-responsive transcription factor AIL1 [Heracleum sosnowskyi]|uniref:AP2-like ethylene-responsive transcription factor AIL1 n=1 Tax=Heracleum sosnowskyi TaxID=360622 RepID=A0AAD8JN40_9APIA|nr:AP2-like ethylene-responsive transcription factor AIL1 [Heracleum sosnowskyi]